MIKNVDISKFSSMKIGGRASYFLKIKYENDIKDVLQISQKYQKSILPIGECSNIVFSNKKINKILVRIYIKGIEIKTHNKNSILLEVGAGENWDKFVKYTVDKGLSGLESLSGIPGTVGACPIQNIGAYGSEVKNNIIGVLVYDLKLNKKIKLTNTRCKFSYRNSLFKKENGRYIILKVIFKLYKNKHLIIPKYKDIENYLVKNKNPNLKEIREAILKIRYDKLPNPKIIPNCGSFFKNPIITKKHASKIIKKFPNMPTFKLAKKVKIPAGFLIEKLGFKGKKISKIEIYKNNALVLTNPDNATFKNLLSVKNIIQKAVFDKFGISLEPEVNLIEK